MLKEQEGYCQCCHMPAACEYCRNTVVPIVVETAAGAVRWLRTLSGKRLVRLTCQRCDSGGREKLMASRSWSLMRSLLLES